MNNIIKFEIAGNNDNEAPQPWGDLCKATKERFAAIGFECLSEDFLQKFKPIYEEFFLELPAPNIPSNTEQNAVWHEQLNDLVAKVSEYRSRLIYQRYMREAEIYIGNL